MPGDTCHSGCSENVCKKIRITIAVIGGVVGILAGLSFGIEFKNYSAASWAVLSGVLAVATLLLHILHHRCHNRLLWVLIVTGVLFVAISIAGFIVYLVIAIEEQQAMDAHGRGFYVTIVWCFMTFKWGAMLAFYGYMYHVRSYTRLDETSAWTGLGADDASSTNYAA